MSKKKLGILTDNDIKSTMQIISKLIDSHINEFGYLFPLIVAIHKGKIVPFDFDEENTFEQVNILNKGEGWDTYYGYGLNAETYLANVNEVHAAVFQYKKLQNIKDEQDIANIYKYIADKFNPDAIIYYQMGFYNTQQNPLTHAEIINDPTTIKAISCYYYKRGHKNPYYFLLPLPISNYNWTRTYSIPTNIMAYPF